MVSFPRAILLLPIFFSLNNCTLRAQTKRRKSLFLRGHFSG
uniref:Uncharacterized protein n=1 Tax=Rhizophora mucronata TaxID=61149 RepID=A0A2P2P3G3_RHIMU